MFLLALSDNYISNKYDATLLNLNKSYYKNQTITILRQWILSSTCSALRFLSISGSVASLLMALTITINRFLTIKYPFDIWLRFTYKRAAIACLAIWSYSLLCGIAVVIIAQATIPLGGKDRNWYSRLCMVDHLDITIAVVFAAFIALNSVIGYLIVTMLYIAILRSIRNVRFTNNKIDSQVHIHSNCHQQDKNTASYRELGVTLTSLIAGTNIFLWLPTTVVVILYAANIPNIGNKKVFAGIGTFITLLFPCNAFINPVILLTSIVIAYYNKRKKRLWQIECRNNQHRSFKNVITSRAESNQVTNVVNPCITNVGG